MRDRGRRLDSPGVTRGVGSPWTDCFVRRKRIRALAMARWPRAVRRIGRRMRIGSLRGKADEQVEKGFPRGRRRPFSGQGRAARWETRRPQSCHSGRSCLAAHSPMHSAWQADCAFPPGVERISLAESARVMHVKHRPCSQERPNRSDFLQAGGRKARRFSSGLVLEAAAVVARVVLLQYAGVVVRQRCASIPSPIRSLFFLRPGAVVDRHHRRVVTTRAQAGSDDARHAAAGKDLPGAGASDDLQ